MIPSTDQAARNLAERQDQTAAIVNGLPELYRRGRIPNRRDGWPSSTMGPEGRGAGDHSDPTANAATGRDPRSDEVTLLALQAARADRESRKWAAEAIGCINRAREIEDDTRGRQNTVPCCLVCDDPAPRPRRGLCEADYALWRRHGMPELTELRKIRQDLENVSPVT